MYTELSRITGDGYSVALFRGPADYAIQQTEAAFIPSKTVRLERRATLDDARALMEEWVTVLRRAACERRRAAVLAAGYAIIG